MVIVNPHPAGYSPSKWPNFMAYKWGLLYVGWSSKWGGIQGDGVFSTELPGLGCNSHTAVACSHLQPEAEKNEGEVENGCISNIGLVGGFNPVEN